MLTDYRDWERPGRIERNNEDKESLWAIFKQFNIFSKTERPSRKEEIQNTFLNALE